MIKLDISLLIAVHYETNEKDLLKSINSIHDQKHIPNEIILIQDGVITNSLSKLIYSLIDQNLINQHLVIEENNGLANALNLGIARSKNLLIARLDPEDEIINDRFYVQYEFLKANQDISICGSFAYEVFNKKEKLIKKPLKNIDIVYSLQFGNPIIHSTVMFRKKLIEKIGCYPFIKKCQDLYLWIKCSEGGYKFANIDLPLLRIFLHSDLILRRDVNYFKFEKIIYDYQLNKNLISVYVYIYQVMSRYILRNLPSKFKIFLYRTIR